MIVKSYVVEFRKSRQQKYIVYTDHTNGTNSLPIFSISNFVINISSFSAYQSIIHGEWLLIICRHMSGEVASGWGFEPANSLSILHDTNHLTVVQVHKTHPQDKIDKSKLMVSNQNERHDRQMKGKTAIIHPNKYPVFS